MVPLHVATQVLAGTGVPAPRRLDLRGGEASAAQSAEPRAADVHIVDLGWRRLRIVVDGEGWAGQIWSRRRCSRPRIGSRCKVVLAGLSML